jgi:hypothetical protein
MNTPRTAMATVAKIRSFFIFIGSFAGEPVKNRL